MIPTNLFDKVSQLLFPRIGSNMLPSRSVAEDADRVASLLEQCPVGGLVLFNGSAIHTPDVLARLQEISAYPLLIATDMERGVGQQLRGATVFPHAFAFDALGDGATAAIGESARISAREAVAAGLHISFSPVVDVHSNPDNPIISIRSYGSNPDDVATRARAYVKACHEIGLYTTAKHFPGHGDTSTDSHIEIPILEKSREELDRMELVPFKAAFDAGVDLVMTAHVAYPALDVSQTVATASQPILVDLLRKELCFDGVVISDSLLMEGAKKNEGAVSGDSWLAELVRSGIDVLLDIPEPKQAAEDLVRAVDAGLLSEERIDEAFSRVWRLKSRFIERFGAHAFRNPSSVVPRSVIGKVEHRRVAENIAKDATKIVSGNRSALPFTKDQLSERGLLVLFVRPHVTYADPTAGSLEEHVRGTFENVAFHEIGPQTDSMVLSNLVEAAPTFAGVVVAAVVKPAAWHRFGLLPEQKQFVSDLIQRCPVVFASLGSPRVLDDFPGIALGISTFSDVDVSQRALIDLLSTLADSG